MRSETAHPCIAPERSARRISRSSVPWRRSSRDGSGGIGVGIIQEATLPWWRMSTTIVARRRVQIHPAQLLPDLGHTRQREAAELNLLASRDVEHAGSQTPGQVCNRAQLVAVRKTVGHSDPHHESPRRWLAKNTPTHLSRSFSAAVSDS